MDCCEYRGSGPPAQCGAWEYGPYAPLPYTPYAHYYPPAPHDPYRYYRYDYPHHAHHGEHPMPTMDYGAYASKEARVRRALSRRETRMPPHHLPLPHTPPLECGMNGRGPAYCEPQMWSHYQMGINGGWNGASGIGAAWQGRGACAREHGRYPLDYRAAKGPHVHSQSQVSLEGRSTPYPVYEEPATERGAGSRAEPVRREEPRPRPPPTPPRPPVVPLPAFQQAFGSTEIGKFAEAFIREQPTLDEPPDSAFDAFPDWDAPEASWPATAQAPQTPRPIKCEDNY